MKHYFLVAKDVGDLTTILCSALEMEQVKASPGFSRLLNPVSWRTRRHIRTTSDFPHRQRPPQCRRRRRLQARSRQPHPLLCQGRGDGRVLPSQCGAAAAAILAADRRQAAQQHGSQPHLPGNALLDKEPRADAQAHERSRRARPLHPRLRPRRVDDAVQHVSPLHGGRASDPNHRRTVRHRTRRSRQFASALQPDHQHRAAPARAVRRGLPARHRQGPRRGPLHRRRAHRAQPRARASA